ncbi:Dps family protein [Marisediminicola senii]|uniref:Dps family protein n=1 Tax=Marisediminicola senii TaxID=2711233 RepID=UPI0013EDCA45|nr:DNA starvation/stationary phase protection protein [Marisediminicola senii]
MTDIRTVPQTSTDPDVAAGVAQFLSPVVIGLTALGVDGKQAHWHVRGPNFQSVHELLDMVVDHARDYADTAAERVVALGLPIDARIQSIAQNTTTPALTPGFQSTDRLIEEIIAEIDAVLYDLRIAVTELGTLDPVSQDVAIEISRALDKDRWFLFAHIASS